MNGYGDFLNFFFLCRVELECLKMRLEVVGRRLGELVKRSDNFLFSLKFFDILSFYQVSQSPSNNLQTYHQTL
jgi:hypothetical protein